MPQITCRYRVTSGPDTCCQIVADLMDRPIAECHTNDSACLHCIKCGVAPQVPNAYTASMAIGVAHRTGDTHYFNDTVNRFRNQLNKSPPPDTACILRGPEIRKVGCKPCQAGSLEPVMVPVYRCPKHNECTLHNTGTFPKIQACATCSERLEKSVQLDVKPAPAAVVAAIPRRGVAPTSPASM